MTDPEIWRSTFDGDGWHIKLQIIPPPQESNPELGRLFSQYVVEAGIDPAVAVTRLEEWGHRNGYVPRPVTDWDALQRNWRVTLQKP